MNKIINWVKKAKLSQIILTFFAGALLIFNTACNSVQATTPNTRSNVPSGVQPDKELTSGRNPRPDVPNEATTNRFQKGTMNDFSDVDPRAEKAESAFSDKAAALKKNAERNIDTKGENAKSLGENLRDSTEGAANKIQGTADDLVRGTKRGVENVKDNSLDATKGVGRAAENTKENIKANTPDTRQLTRDAKRNLDKAGNAIKDAVD